MTEKSKPAVIGGLTRILPYCWPYRKRLFLSFGFAVLVALFWGLNLSVAFPVVKVLLQGEKLTDYAQSRIESARKDVAFQSAYIERLNGRIAELGDEPGRREEKERIELLSELSQAQSRLSTASRDEAFMSWLDQRVIRHLPEDQFDLLALILGVLLIATLLRGYFTYMQDQLTGVVVELTTMSIRKECFRRVLKLDFQSISREGGTPGLMSRFTFDMNVMSRGLQLLGGKFFREPLKAICCIVLAFMVNWRLTLLSMIVLPVTGLVFYRFGRSLKKASHRMMESMSRLCKTMEEAFDSIKIVLAYGGERRHRQRFHRENKEYLAKSLKIVRIDSLTSPSTEFLAMCAVFLALFPGAYLVLRGTTQIWGIKLAASRMDIAELSMLYVLLIGTLDPIRRLSTVYSVLKRSSAAADRVFELVDKQPLVQEVARPLPLHRHCGQIEFRNIEFSYESSEDSESERPAALRDASLTVEHGETIVVVGENGSGKSTLVNLLPRYYDPQRGDVLVDGVDIRKCSLRDLRGQLAVVTQETLLFDESIYENIRYGNPEATREEILDAARRAHVTDFLDQLPDGLNTRIGERGGKLSGGQRQRIALARAIVRNPAIMILDEATSAVDAQSELLIHATLKDFLKGRTSFIISHSVTPSMLAFTSRIVVMEQGRVVAQGTHDQLIGRCPQYQRLYHAHRRPEAA